MAERDSKGRFLPGTTGNPKGRPKDTPPAEDIIEAALPEVIMRLIDLMQRPVFARPDRQPQRQAQRHTTSRRHNRSCIT